MARTHENGTLVLIVDDEDDLRSVLAYNLDQAGYRTAEAATGAAALERAVRLQPNIIVLDLNLPDLQGTEVLRKLKANPSTESVPVVILSARGCEEDRVLGLELGADDYVAKPFSVRELLLRVDVVRRHHALVHSTGMRGGRVLTAGGIELDPDAYEVRANGRDVQLALLEFRLLEFLLTARGTACARDELLRKVWAYPRDSETRTIETHVKRLRAKLGDAGEQIETVRGIGYRIRAADRSTPQA
jgi:two-component system phosphate regulon response regulator PhoB